MAKEIADITDIKFLVDTFYGKVRSDAMLADIFEMVIKDRWLAHLEKMYTFWQTVLLGEHTYYGNPFAPHAGLPVEKVHFDRWIALFYQTIDEHYTGEIAAEAKWRAGKMAEMFQLKIAYYKNNQIKPIQ